MRRYDREAALLWLETLYQDLDPLATFQTFDDKAKKDRDLIRTLHGTLSQHWNQLVSLNERGAGIFVTVNQMDGKGRKKTNCKRVQAWWTDYDAGKDLPELPLTPSLLVDTKHGYHPIWCAEGEVTPDACETLNKRIAAALGGDSKVTDCSRVLRLPGFWHCKKDEPYPITIKSHVDVSYTQAQMEAAFPPLPELKRKEVLPPAPPRRTDTPDINTRYGLAGLAEEERRVQGAVKGERNDTLNRAAYSIGQLIAGGELERDLATARLESAAIDIGLTKSEARQTIASALRASANSPRNAPPHGGHLQLAASQPVPDVPEPAPWPDDAPDWQQHLIYAQGPKGWKLGKNESNLVLILTHDERWEGCLRYDVFSGKTRWYRPPPQSGGFIPPEGEFQEHHATLIAHWFGQVHQIKIPRETALKAAMDAGREKPIHPVREYLNGCTWDGQERISSWLVDLCGAADKPITRRIGRWWLISAVARIFSPGCQSDHIMILEGKQGVGKSQLVRYLAGPEWFQGSIGDLRTKEAAQNIQGAWIVEVGELDAFRGAAATRIKDFLTQPIDRFRPSYGRVAVDHPRQCVFVGTTNERQYLTDATGNRRFWPVYCDHIQADRIRELRDQLWAEAVMAYRQGEIWWPKDASESEPLAEEQADRSQIDAWREIIDERLHGRMEPVTTGDILKMVGLDSEKWDRASQIRAGAILTTLGWQRERRRVNGIRAYVYHPPEAQEEFDL